MEAAKVINTKGNNIKDLNIKKDPSVTIGIPVLNEEEHIERVISGFLNSDYSNLLEIFVADGGSSDRTTEIVKNISKKDPRVQLLENPEKFQSFALNKMINAANGEIFLRADAHCEYGKDYIEKCVFNLHRDGVKNTGGAARFLATNLVQAGTAISVFSLLGNGGAKHYNPEYEGYSDTVPMGCFYTSDLKKLNGFTESNHTNEDSEINYRLRKNLDGKIYISPEIILQYYPRKSFTGLFKQYFKYGRGRYLTGSMHKGKIPFRSKAPFLFTGTMILLLLIDNLILPNVLGSFYILSACLLLLFFEAMRLAFAKRDYFCKAVWKSETKKPPMAAFVGLYSFVILIIMHFAHFSGYGYQMLRMKVFGKNGW
ncbi:MAG: glycosyltransferase family 2 protein [Balneolaceae bacterium]